VHPFGLWVTLNLSDDSGLLTGPKLHFIGVNGSLYILNGMRSASERQCRFNKWPASIPMA
jgi:hypothetical protein